MKSHPRAKLSEQDVLEIIRLASEGVRTGILAEKFSTGKNTVLDIIRGKTWKSLPRPPMPERKTGVYPRKRKYGPTCSIPGCGKPHDAKGWCSAHWYRWRVHGDPLGGRTPVGEPLEFLRKLIDDDPSECVEWPYSRTGNGYGLVVYEGVQRVASRVLCKMVHGDPPSEDWQAAHSCGNGHLGCVTPAHIRWATAEDNNNEKNTPTGEAHPSAKLKWEQVKAIRHRANAESFASLSREFGVSASTIRDIVSGRIWKADPAIRALKGGSE